MFYRSFFTAFYTLPVFPIFALLFLITILILVIIFGISERRKEKNDPVKRSFLVLLFVRFWERGWLEGGRIF